LLGTSKPLIAGSIKLGYSDMVASPVLKTQYVQMIFCANAALKEGIPEEFRGRVDERGLFYPVSFPDLLDIWAQTPHTPMGPATWQFLANVLHADIILYKPGPNGPVPVAQLRSQRVSVLGVLREYHIGLLRTEAGDRYALITPPRLKH
jgi:hypothetical protein